MASPIHPRSAPATRPSSHEVPGRQDRVDLDHDPELDHRPELDRHPDLPDADSERSDRFLRSGLRPLPPQSPVERVRSWLAARSVGGSALTAARAGDLTQNHRARFGAGPPVDPGGPDAEAPPPLRRFTVPILLCLVTAAVGWWLARPPSPPLESALPAAGTVPASGAQPAGASTADPAGVAAPPGGTVTPGEGVTGGSAVDPAPLVVHATGAVTSPGVYRLPAGARIDDLVRAAGGITADGDPDRVNLAAPLVDGERVWVPRRGEGEAPDVVAGRSPSGTGTAAPGSTPTGGPGSSAGVDPVVDLNTATAEELDTLPGVGPATAAAILSYREQNGPFASVDDLLEVRGIGEAKLEQIRPLVRT